MSLYRMYAGDDGQSHVEKLDLAHHPELMEPRATTDIVFREAPPGRFSGWHRAPRRQYIFQLSGDVEVGMGDGSTQRYRPGDVRLVEDLTGKGHTTRVVGDQPSITAVIPLAE